MIPPSSSEKKQPNYQGLLLINKPKGITSFSLVSILRKVTGVKKIGHAGTLDPFATGVMVMLVGKPYTRLSSTFLNCEKEYVAKVLLGASTDSYDLDGKVVETSDKIPSLDEVQSTLKRLFCGKVYQTPPMFSAKKIGGKKLYDLARKGISIEREPVLVEIDTTFLSYNYPLLSIHVRCSKGTYIRSIAHDLGKALGCGAHLTALTRIKSGDFTIEQCTPLETIKSASFELLNYFQKNGDSLS